MATSARALPAGPPGHVVRCMAGVPAPLTSQSSFATVVLRPCDELTTLCTVPKEDTAMQARMAFDLDEYRQQAWEAYVKHKTVALFACAECGKSTFLCRAT